MYEVEKIYSKVFAENPHHKWAWANHGGVKEAEAADICHTVYGVDPVLWYLMESRKIDFYRDKQEDILAFLETLPLGMPRNKKYSTARARFASPTQHRKQVTLTMTMSLLKMAQLPQHPVLNQRGNWTESRMCRRVCP
jgi:hypothetical protein